jgi:hypothetical protein
VIEVSQEVEETLLDFGYSAQHHVTGYEISCG